MIVALLDFVRIFLLNMLVGKETCFRESFGEWRFKHTSLAFARFGLPPEQLWTASPEVSPKSKINLEAVYLVRGLEKHKKIQA